MLVHCIQNYNAVSYVVAGIHKTYIDLPPGIVLGHGPSSLYICGQKSCEIH